MARFRAWIEGRYGNQASRMGDEGIVAEVTAAKVGVFVQGVVAEGGGEEFQVFATQGRIPGDGVFLGTVQLDASGEVRFTVNNAALVKKEDR